MIVRSRMFTPALRLCSRQQLLLHSRSSLTHNFHATRPNHTWGEISVQLAYHAFEYIHVSSGLPWAVSIPITAMLIRTCFNLPVYYLVFKNHRMIHKVVPLLEAHRNARIYNTRRVLVKEPAPTSFSKAQEYYAELGINPWAAALPLAYLPVWLASIDALAHMCGAGESKLNPSFDHIVPRIPSLASEGLFWFPDLTAFDPGLCAMFGYLCIANAMFGVYKSFTFVGQTTKLGLRRQDSKIDDMERVTLLAVGGGLFFAIQPPAAIALFCMSSSLCAVVQRSFMKRSFGENKNIPKPARTRSVVMREQVHEMQGGKSSLRAVEKT